MRKVLFTLLAALALVACNNSNVYTINGALANYNGSVALTTLRGDLLVETTTAEDGTFTLAHQSDYPFSGLIRIDEPGKEDEHRYIVQIYGDDVKEITLTGTDTDLVIEGGAANAVNTQMRAINQEVVDRQVAGATREELMAYYEAEMERLYEENKDNLYGVMQMIRQKSYDMTGEQMLEAIAALPEAYKSMPEVEKLSVRAQALVNVAIGKPFVEIEVPDAEGNNVKLSDVVKENKYTLLDFWASWCGPCMGEVPHLVEAYKEFGPKGFEIYGVSLDKTKELWLRTIEEREMNWVNVSNLLYWQEPSAALYGVGSIPSNFLIDGEGKIVARNLRGEELAEMLSELLK